MLKTNKKVTIGMLIGEWISTIIIAFVWGTAVTMFIIGGVLMGEWFGYANSGGVIALAIVLFNSVKSIGEKTRIYKEDRKSERA